MPDSKSSKFTDPQWAAIYNLIYPLVKLQLLSALEADDLEFSLLALN